MEINPVLLPDDEVGSCEPAEIPRCRCSNRTVGAQDKCQIIIVSMLKGEPNLEAILEITVPKR